MVAKDPDGTLYLLVLAIENKMSQVEIAFKVHNNLTILIRFSYELILISLVLGWKMQFERISRSGGTDTALTSGLPGPHFHGAEDLICCGGLGTVDAATELGVARTRILVFFFGLLLDSRAVLWWRRRFNLLLCCGGQGTMDAAT